MWDQCRISKCKKSLAGLGRKDIGFCKPCWLKLHPLRRIRRERDIHQKMMAYLMGIAQPTLSMIEMSRFRVSYTVLDNLESKLNIDINQFLRDVREHKQLMEIT